MRSPNGRDPHAGNVRAVQSVRTGQGKDSSQARQNASISSSHDAAAYAESALLGACLLSSEAADAVCRQVPPDAWSRHAHRLVADAMRRLFERAQPVDLTSTTVELIDSHDLDEVGGPVALLDLQEPATCAVSSWPHYLTLVLREGRRRADRARYVAAVEALDAGADPAEVAREVAP